MWFFGTIPAPGRQLSQFYSESPKPLPIIDSLCATSSPAGPAWLEPCRHVITAPRRGHHRQPRDRARPGKHRTPPRPSPGDVHRGKHHRPRPPDGGLPGRGRHLPPGGHPLRAPVGEGSPRLERGERDRHRQCARPSKHTTRSMPLSHPFSFYLVG